MTKVPFIVGLAFLLVSCSSKKHLPAKELQTSTSYLRSELYFNDCDSLLTFLKAVIIDNNTDPKLKVGQFKIPFISPTYENSKSLFPEKCFVGLTDKELIEIFGRWDYAGKSENHPAWYLLESRNDQLAIEVFIREGLVEKFKVSASTVQN